MTRAMAVKVGNRVSFSHPSASSEKLRFSTLGSGGSGAPWRRSSDERPREQDDHHYRGDLDDVQGVGAGFVHPLRVAPPEVHDDDDCEPRREEVARHGQRHVVVRQHVADEAGDVEPGRHGANRTRQDVIEQQRRHGQLRQRTAHGFLDDAVHAAADEHHGALDVDRPDDPREEHHAEDEPRGGLADGLFGDAAGVERGRPHVAEDNGGGSPEGDEREQNGGGHHDPRGLNGRGLPV